MNGSDIALAGALIWLFGFLAGRAWKTDRLQETLAATEQALRKTEAKARSRLDEAKPPIGYIGETPQHWAQYQTLRHHIYIDKMPMDAKNEKPIRIRMIDRESGEQEAEDWETTLIDARIKAEKMLAATLDYPREEVR